jgi:hypothetical protein
MSLHRLFAWIITRHRGSNQLYEDQEGALLSRRLQELLDVTKPKTMETFPYQLREDGKDQRNLGAESEDSHRAECKN